MRTEVEVMKTFMDWANHNEFVRTAIMTSSRTNKESNIDFLSDYDIELYVSDLDSFTKDDHWLNIFGDIMVRWPFKARSTGDDDWITRLIMFEDGVRIDFQITALKAVVDTRYINGYTVLIDKDSKAKNIPKPTYKEFYIHKPSKDEFEAIVNEFWWDVYYVPKYLWRDELPFAKYMLDHILHYEFLHKVIDWYIGYKNNWDIETGVMGKKYKSLLSEKDWTEFEAIYCGGGMKENLIALERITSLFRRLSIELSQALAYDYPYDVDKKVMSFCREIMETPKI